jgi:single-strand DNA-binding protein
VHFHIHNTTMNELIASLLRASQHRFIGRLGKDPETKYFQSGSSVTTCRIAVNKPGAKRDDGQEPDWFKVEIWGEAGVSLADTARKGDLIDVSGRVKTESWTGQDGEERRQLTVTADVWSPVGKPAPVAVAPAVSTPVPAAAPKTEPDWLSSDQMPF